MCRVQYNWPAPPGVPLVRRLEGPPPGVPTVRRLEGPLLLVSLLSVCSLYVIFFLILYVTFFLILLQYNIRPPDPNCNVCDPEFAPGVNLSDTIL